jgi:hypothetical protein
MGLLVVVVAMVICVIIFPQVPAWVQTMDLGEDAGAFCEHLQIQAIPQP